MDEFSNLENFEEQISVFEPDKEFCYWNIGTPVFSDLVNFYRRLISYKGSMDLYELQLFVVRYQHTDGEMYALLSEDGHNFAPNDFMNEDKTYFKLGAMRQYIEILASFGLITCNVDFRVLKGTDLLKKNYDNEKMIFKLNPIIISFLNEPNTKAKSFINLCFDLLKINSRLRISWAESFAYSILISYGAAKIADSEQILKNIPGQKGKHISETCEVYFKNSIKNGYDGFFEFIDDYSNENWTENVANFIMEVLPYEN